MHRTKTSNVYPLASARAGDRVLRPPFSAERAALLGIAEGAPIAIYEFVIQGKGWRESAADIVFPGLGWISVTGSGELSVRTQPPRDIPVYVREPVMPFEARESSRKFTGTGSKRW